MKGSLQIARLGGIPLRVHWSFPLLFVLVAAADAGSGASAVAQGLLWVLAVFAAVTVHELAHSLVARRRGLVVKDIVLLPIGGVSEIQGIESAWRDELVTAAAGPAASVALALALALVGLGAHLGLWPPTLFAGSWVSRLLWANVLLAAFNLLPALPLDGGRVLHAFLVRRQGETKGTVAAARLARLIAALLVVGGLFYNLWVALIGAFLFVAAGWEERRALARASLGGLKVRQLTVPETPVEASMTVEQLVLQEGALHSRSLPVVEHGRYVGILDADSLAGAADHTAVSVLVDRTAPLLGADMDVFPDALDAFDRTGRSALPVAEGERVTGVLYGSRIDEALRGRQEEPRPAWQG